MRFAKDKREHHCCHGGVKTGREEKGRGRFQEAFEANPYGSPRTHGPKNPRNSVLITSRSEEALFNKFYFNHTQQVRNSFLFQVKYLDSISY